MTRRFLWGAVAVALTMAGLPSVLAQYGAASQQGGVQTRPQPANYQAPGTAPSAPLPAPAAPGPAPQAERGATTPAAPGTAAPAAPGTTTPSPAATNENNLFSQAGQGAEGASEAESFAPNMIGDWLAPTFVTVQLSGMSPAVPSPSGGFGRFKMADDTSPLPQDRLILDGSYFGGALCANGAGGTTSFGVEGLEVGFEKTILSGAASIEVRVPLSSVDTMGGQIGDLGMAFKGLLINQRDLAISAGMSMNVPTAPNTVATGLDMSAAGNPFRLGQFLPQNVTIENQSVHLLPFVGALWMPSGRFFAQGYVQVDADASGNEVLFGPTGYPLTSLGRLHDPTFLYVDLGAGYWLRRGDYSRLINGIACMGEIHVDQSLEPGGVLSAGFRPLTPVNYSFVDFTVGVHLDVGRQCNVTLGYVAPLTDGPEKEFDGEFRLLCNYRF